MEKNVSVFKSTKEIEVVFKNPQVFVQLWSLDSIPFNFSFSVT